MQTKFNLNNEILLANKQNLRDNNNQINLSKESEKIKLFAISKVQSFTLDHIPIKLKYSYSKERIKPINKINLVFEKNQTKKKFRNNISEKDLQVNKPYDIPNGLSYIIEPKYKILNKELILSNNDLDQMLNGFNYKISNIINEINKIQYEKDVFNNIFFILQELINKLIIGEEQKKRLNQYIHAIRGNLRVYCRVKPKPKVKILNLIITE